MSALIPGIAGLVIAPMPLVLVWRLLTRKPTTH